ncbi:unnamed protein product [Cylicocyclus nassatus]|uniref:7TM GPCR serpentine receptor class x (Srx) domain-containing protein n=1 Tax=Cylicocyclus nassatus TaxID=53992 RepID=A0AA36MBH8_CYLNA|nr:unnamed protein product [Cylicocyclus nassatus]
MDLKAHFTPSSKVGIPGLLVNLFNVYLFLTTKSLRTPYGHLTISRCIANAHKKTTYAMSDSKRKSDRRIIRIVIQGIIQDSTFLLETLVFTFAPVIVESTTGIFVCYSLIWELAHAIDGWG